MGDDHAARFHVGEQFGQPVRDPIVRVISANAEHDCVETLEVFRGDIGHLQHLHVVTDLLKALRNLIARAGNIPDQFAFFPNIGPDDPGFRRRHQEVGADVGIGDAFARERIIASIDGHDRAQRAFPGVGRRMNGEGRKSFGVRIFQIDRRRRRLDPPSLRGFEPELTGHRARRSRHAHLDGLRFVVTENEGRDSANSQRPAAR